MSDNTGISWTDATWNRFTSSIDIGQPDSCWNWTAGCFTKGYGQFRVGKRKVRAHRAYFERVVQPIPDGFILCHRCDNPKCCNPAHLYIGTHTTNAADRSSRGRDGRGFKAQPGEQNGAAKLTSESVRCIREAYGLGETYTTLAARFGVSKSTIGNVIRGESWC